VISFRLTYLDNRLVGIESEHPDYKSFEPELPLVTKDRIQVMLHNLPDGIAESYYNTMKNILMSLKH